MRVAPVSWHPDQGWSLPAAARRAGLVLYFGSRAALADGARHRDLMRACPQALLLGCSTGGHGSGPDIGDDDILGVALAFRATGLRLAAEDGATVAGSRACGLRLGRHLAGEGLAGVFVLSDGLNVNGSALVAGFTEALGPGVPVSGGLAGDGAAFRTTLIAAGAAPPAPGRVAAIGFYGPHIRFGHGCAGGWDRFGPERRITRAEGNVLLALDGAPALDLYERYLAEEASGLPGTALLFPLRIWDPGRPGHDVVRTVLAVDRAARSMTFAGDMPQGWMAQLMRGGINRLSDGAAVAAGHAAGAMGPGAQGSLAILVSCIGRRLLMGQRVGEEIEAAMAQLPPGLPVIAFYSYGEVAPHAGSGCCELHNQTMSVTLLREAA